MQAKEGATEKTGLVIIKPDGIGYFDYIIDILKKKDIRILSLKSKRLMKSEVEDVYREHKGRYFFNSLVDYMLMGKCFLLAIRGDYSNIESAKKEIRELAKKQGGLLAVQSLSIAVNSTKISEAADISQFIEKFVNEYSRTFDGIHCSDFDSADREVSLFFDEDDLAEPDFNIEHSTAIVCQKLIAAQEHQKSALTNAAENYRPSFFNN